MARDKREGMAASRTHRGGPSPLQRRPRPLMRIVSGSIAVAHCPRRNRRRSGRPPTGCAKSLFNILAHCYGDPVKGARVLDLFAGTGALGLEALSRGAAFVLFVDDGAEARALLRGNVDALGAAASDHFPPRRDAARPARIRWSRSRSPFSIRPTAKVWPSRRLRRRATAAGSRRMR